MSCPFVIMDTMRSPSFPLPGADDSESTSNDDEVANTIELPPSAAVNIALGSNHDIVTGLDELIDNSLDAEARSVVIVFHVEHFRLQRISIHDDGIGMSRDTLTRVLRLGGHEAYSHTRNIGRYGIGMKEGSFANARRTTVVSRVRGQEQNGVRLRRDSFTADVLTERTVSQLWNLRAELQTLHHGTSIIWDDLVENYQGKDQQEGRKLFSNLLEKLRKHIGIRYHRRLQSGEVTIQFRSQWDDLSPAPTPAPRPIDPFDYMHSGRKGYPRTLTLDGVPDAPAITAHIWTNRSAKVEYKLTSNDPMGHQGFYVYDADRMITCGDWCGYQTPKKELKLLRIEISDPRVLNDYLTISPQKGSVRLEESFRQFISRLRDPEDPSVDFDQVLSDATETLKDANRRSSKADLLAVPGLGLAGAIKDVIWENDRLKDNDPLKIVWGQVESGDFLEVHRQTGSSNKNPKLVLNQDYRPLFASSKDDIDDAPLVKALVYLLFGDIATKKSGAKAQANENLWIDILNAAAEETQQRQEIRADAASTGSSATPTRPEGRPRRNPMSRRFGAYVRPQNYDNS